MTVLGKIGSGFFSRGVTISLGVHALVLALLLFGPPRLEPMEAPVPEAVAVLLVPPPEPQLEPDPQPEPADSAAPPAQPEPEQSAAEDSIPPPAEPPAREEVDDAAMSRAPAVPIPVLRPVFQFGERDSGPRESLDGGSAVEPATDLTPEDMAEDMAEDQPAAAPLDEAPVAEGAPEPATLADLEQARAIPPRAGPEPAPGAALPEIDLPQAALSLPAANAPASDPASSADPVPAAVLAPKEDQRDSEAQAKSSPGTPGPKPEPAANLTEARQLYSPVLTEDAAAMVAMGSLPRAVRASQLCTTELREQLRRATPPYRPELLPSYGLDSGNVLTVGDAAFRAEGLWYDLRFSCTVDDDAFQVAAFAFSVGKAIPRSQWQARGFPSF